MMLEVPVNVFASLGADQEAIEKEILARIKTLTRPTMGDEVTEVVVAPSLVDHLRIEEVTQSRPDVEPEPIPRFWQPGYFRLFVSHVSSEKERAHKLKEPLASYQVATFVAHDDIEPSREWQAEIESALRTMDALVALVSPGFISSQWCDQEVGIALGRGKPVIPIMLNAVPHGFLGKLQGMKTGGLTAWELADKLVEILIRHTGSVQRMAEALVERLVRSKSWDSSKRTIALLEQVPSLNASQLGRLVTAINENSEVGDAFGVPDRIRALVTHAGAAGASR